MNSILVPTHALDISLLQRLADSIDFSVKNKVIINNGHKNSLNEWSNKNPDWQIYQQEYNIGVAASWNLAPKVFKEDAWLILNDDQELQHGCLEIICTETDKNLTSDIIYVNEHEAYDIFVWTRKGFETFGSFDENFYPIYFEDWEMKVRFELGKANKHIIKEHIPVKHGKIKPTPKAYNEMLKKVGEENRTYFISKWGVDDFKNKPLFNTPYNSPNLGVKDWEFLKERRIELRKITDAFFNDVNVSLY